MAECYIVTESDKKGKGTKIILLSQLEALLHLMRRLPVASPQKLFANKTYYFKTRMAIKVSYTQEPIYQLLFNIFSVFKYRTTFFYSIDYKGASLLKATVQNPIVRPREVP